MDNYIKRPHEYINLNESNFMSQSELFIHP